MAVTAYIDRLKRAGITFASFDPTAKPSNASPLDSAETLSNLHLSDVGLAQSYVYAIYAKLKRHYEWFRTTQRGQVKEWGRTAMSRTEAYRWRGRTEDHVLTSGLDDYPRARPPHLGELHLDLAAWMAFFTKTMSEIAEFLGETEDLAEYEANYIAGVANIEGSSETLPNVNPDADPPKSQIFTGVRRTKCTVMPVSMKMVSLKSQTSLPSPGAHSDVDLNIDESYHVCHPGYISLFPFLLGLLPADSDHLGPILDLVRDPEQLWSPYGLRSLSLKDPYFGQGENYWRGPIWIQMNYLALSSLSKVSLTLFLFSLDFSNILSFLLIVDLCETTRTKSSSSSKNLRRIEEQHYRSRLQGALYS